MARVARQTPKVPVPNICPYLEDPGDEKKDIQEWITRFRTYLRCIQASVGGTDPQPLNDEYKKMTLELLLGSEGSKDLARNPEYGRAEEMTYEEFETVVVAHFRKRKSTIKARVDFHRRYQEAGETIHDYVRQLRKIAEDANFDNPDNAIQTQLVTGTNDVHAQTELMSRIDMPDLEEIIEILSASETASEDLRRLRGTPSGENHVRAVNENTRGRVNFRRGIGSRFQRASFRGVVRGQGRGAGFQQVRRCEGCGQTNHLTRDPGCRALGKTCMRCGGLNHFAAMCKAATPSANPELVRLTMRGRGVRGNRWQGHGGQTGAVHFDASMYDDADEVRKVDDGGRSQTVKKVDNKKLIYEDFWVQNGKNGQKRIQMLVDTGATMSILSWDTLTRMLPAVKMEKVESTLTGANKEPLRGCIGSIDTSISYVGRSHVGRLHIFRKRGIDIISTNFLKPLGCRVDCEKMEVVTVMKQLSVMENQKLLSKMNEASDTEDPSSPASRKLNQIQQTVERLQEDLYKTETVNEELQRTVEATQKENEELKGRIDELVLLEHQYRRLKDEVDEFSSKADDVRKMETKLETYRRKIEDQSDLKAQVKILEEKNENYMRSVIELEEEQRKNANFKIQLERLVATYRRMPQEDGRSPAEKFLQWRVRGPEEPNRVIPMRRTSEYLGVFHGEAEFRLGEEVLVMKPQVPKGQSPWRGPLKVMKVLGRYTFELSDGQVWNARKMMRKWVRSGAHLNGGDAVYQNRNGQELT